jgi:hypothetical protein
MTYDGQTTIEIPLWCTNCGGELRATVGPADPSSKPSDWVCPYCRETHTTDFGGKLYWIVKHWSAPGTGTIGAAH